MKIKTLCLILFTFTILQITDSYANNTASYAVKVFVTQNPIDYQKPWQTTGLIQGGGSGCIIKGNRIITNAHVVNDSTFIQVKKNTEPKKYTAHVEAISHDCDLAILKVEDPTFFNNTASIDFGDLPKLQDTVTVIGYPTGGDELSITEGVVSRTEIITYLQSNRKLLGVQIDAAINPGNSGGPVVIGNKLVGIAMQHLSSGQNIGYIIPMPIINHFLKDLSDGKYNGFPLLGIEFQSTENASTRDFLNIRNKKGGVFITKVLPFSPAGNNLKENDVLLEIDGIEIGEDGTFEFRNNERLLMTHIASEKQIGDMIRLKVLREGKLTMISFPLTDFINLVPNPNAYEKPPFFILGGLVFSVLSTDLIKSYGSKWWQQAPLDYLSYLVGKDRLNPQKLKDVVVLLNILPDDINAGYHTHGEDIVAKINGKEFESFKDFVLLLNELKNKEDYLIFETVNSFKIIISTKNIDSITSEIIKRNNINNQYSKDVGMWLNEINPTTK